MKDVFLSVLVLISCMATSQEMFQRSNSDLELAKESVQLPDGSIMVIGTTSTAGHGDKDIAVSKYNADGSLLWCKAYGGTSADYGEGICYMDGYVYIVAHSTSYTMGLDDICVAKLDTDGFPIWRYLYGGSNVDKAYSIAGVGDTAVIVVGETESYGAGNGDVVSYLIPAFGSASPFWTHTIGYTGYDAANKVKVIDDQILVVGQFGDEGCLSKIGIDGTLLWTKTYTEGVGTIGSFSDIIKYEDGYLLVGSINSSSGSGLSDIWTTKVDFAGNVVWSQTYGADMNEFCVGVQPRNGGGFVVAGTSESFTGSKFVMLGVDASQVLNWSRVYYGASDIVASDLMLAEDGGLMIVGQSTTGYQHLVSTSQNGFSTCSDSLVSLNGNSLTLNVTDDASDWWGFSYTSFFTNPINFTSTSSMYCNATCDVAVTFTTDSVSCSGTNDGSATAIIGSGISPFETVWSPSADSQIGLFADSLAGGSHWAVVKDSLGCEVKDSIEIGDPNPTVIAGSDISVCENSGDVILTASGTADTYSWDGGITDGVPFTPLFGSTIYTVTGELTATGCARQDSVEVVVNPNPVVSFVVTDEIYGADGAIDMTISAGTPPYWQDWQLATGGSAMDEDLTDLIAGVYVVQVDDANGCTIDGIFDTVYVNSQIGINENIQEELMIYPNPTDGLIWLKSDLSDLGKEYSIVDIAGKVILRSVIGETLTQLDLSDYNPGLYVLIMQSSTGMRETKIVLR